ncbi:MAG TPA: hypothetical protein VN721_01495 [Flavipsychrobacter sp.]|nr:hypothetical protein [Flavipsychrobacter sp.]
MKARLKTIVISALSTLIAFSAATYTSCSPDKCKAINCAYGGVCNNGACTCQTGYEGTQCEVITRDKFTDGAGGTVWYVKEKGTISTEGTPYNVTIADGAAINQVVIKHFYNSFASDVNAYVIGDSIKIPQQTINGSTVVGYGYLDTADHSFYMYHKLVMYYSVSNASGTDDFGLGGGSPSVWTR